jgi:hypothetical protein
MQARTRSWSLNPKPSTLNPQPSTLNPQVECRHSREAGAQRNVLGARTAVRHDAALRYAS